MAYTFNGDIVSSVLECGQAMYDKFLDENNNFHTGYAPQYTWGDEYIGIGKPNYYYYRYYGAKKNPSGSTDKYSLLFEAFRTPFNINDDMIRPFFMRPKNDIIGLYSLYVGVKENKGNWNFNSNRYGNVNNSIDTSLLDNSSFVTRLLKFNVEYGNNHDNTVDCVSYGIKKTSSFSVNYFQKYDNDKCKIYLP